MSSPLGFKGFGVPEAERKKTVTFEYKSNKYEITHGSVVLAAITSCTNTSNPAVMLGAGIPFLSCSL
jgi:aconitate hydratase